MSQKIEAELTCPNCDKQFDITLYRSIWGEIPENRELVMSDNINVAICPYCNQSTKVEFPFMYTNKKKRFAVWWEPEFDPQIDIDAKSFIKMFGPNNYLATAPRIKSWDEFKNTILKFENIDLDSKSKTIGNKMNDQMNPFLKQKQNKKNKKKAGCLSVAFILFVFCSFLLYSISIMIF